ncbi:choice-of-anchor D domain-containing protein [Salinarchaeum sp. Harcht-Bsk1]|uniref:choice-of-anchor D domain-containing protein n=1 Tax=Salinarchaeum sp. Harcht-Bsk1 TaxID=1333523 RepID=UPI0011818ED2|nr:choice-of-anchor D domain-containing protein [Salinarchaeum sp. Harcht-Bsk1]
MTDRRRDGVALVLVGVLLAVALTTGPAAAAGVHANGTITDCGTIDQPGGYELAGNVTNSSDDYCLQVATSNVTIDGNGHTVDGVDDLTGYGVSAVGSSVSNVTVRNLTVTNFYHAGTVEKASDVTFRNLTATASRDHGVVIDGGSGVRVTDSAVDGSGSAGVFAVNTANLSLRNATVTDNAGRGVSLDAVRNVTIQDTLTANNSRWAMTATNGSTVSSATNYTLTGGQSVDFSAHDVSLRANETPPALPAWKHQLGPVLNATNESAGAWLELGYDGSSLLPGHDEGSTTLWRYEGNWSINGGSNAIDTVNDTVNASIDAAGSYALLADEEPIANATPASLDFGTVHMTDPATTRAVTVANDGQAPLTVVVVGATGENASAFYVPPLIGNLTLQPGENASFDVEFDPTTERGQLNATFVAAHDGSSEFANVSLTGRSVAPNVNVTTGPTVDFGEVHVGTPSRGRTIVVENNGSAPLDLPDATITGENATAFDFHTDGDPTPHLLAPGDQVAFEVELLPASLGTKSATLEIAHNVSNRATVTLTLRGTGADLRPPQIANLSAVDATDGDGIVTDGDAITIGANVSDGVTGVSDVSVNASAFGAGTVTLSNGSSGEFYDATVVVDAANASADGVHQLDVNASDAAGNANDTAAGSVTLDTTAPSVSITTPMEGYALNGSNLTVTGTVSDQFAGVQSVAFDDGTGWTDVGFDRGAGTWNATITNLSAGAHTYRVRATDDVSHVSAPI